MNVNTEQYLLKFQQPLSSQPRSERDELLDKFYDHKLQVMEKGKLRLLEKGELAAILSKYTKWENWHALYKSCEQANSFSRLFWYKIKNR